MAGPISEEDGVLAVAGTGSCRWRVNENRADGFSLVQTGIGRGLSAENALFTTRRCRTLHFGFLADEKKS